MVGVIGRRLIGSFFVFLFLGLLTISLLSFFPDYKSEVLERDPTARLKPSAQVVFQKILRGSSVWHDDVNVVDLVRERFAHTFQLASFAIVLTLLSALVISFFLYLEIVPKILTQFLGSFIFSLPAIVLTPIMIWIFYFWLRWFTFGRFDTFADYFMPSLTLSLKPAFQMGYSFVESMKTSRDRVWIRNFQALGFSNFQIFFPGLLRKWLHLFVMHLPVMVASFLSGSIIVESMFAYHGLGMIFYDALSTRDYPIVLGLTFYFATVLMVVQIFSDLAIEFLDPRLRVSSPSPI